MNQRVSQQFIFLERWENLFGRRKLLEIVLENKYETILRIEFTLDSRFNSKIKNHKAIRTFVVYKNVTVPSSSNSFIVNLNKIIVLKDPIH